MITGTVNPFHEAVVRLLLRAASGQQQEIEAVLDTGFSGSLTLPPHMIETLGLPFRSRGGAILADGSEATFDIYAAVVVWDGLPRPVLVEAADTDPLLGMALLHGHDLHIQVVDGGHVTVKRLP